MGVVSPAGAIPHQKKFTSILKLMKLHLPKPLRNSVLACIAAVAGIATPTLGTATFAGGIVAFTLATQQAAAATYLQGDSLYYIGGATQDDLNSETITGVTVETPEGGKRTTVIEEIDTNGKSTVNIAADSNQNAWTNAEIGLLKVQAGATIDVKASDWDSNRYFDVLRIEALDIADSGSVTLGISKTGHHVVLGSILGSLSTTSITEDATLTLDLNNKTAYDAGEGQAYILGPTTGSGTVVIAKGTVAKVQKKGDGKQSHIQSQLKVQGGAKLLLENDATGWSSNITKALILTGTSADEKAEVVLEDNVTMVTDTVFEGYGKISGDFNYKTFGGNITVSGKGNEIASKFSLSSPVEINVLESGELKISGNVESNTHDNGNRAVTKTGAGTLNIGGASNTFAEGLAVDAGTLKISGNTTVQSFLTVGNGACLNLQTGATLTIDKYIHDNAGTVTVSGTLNVTQLNEQNYELYGDDYFKDTSSATSTISGYCHRRGISNCFCQRGRGLGKHCCRRCV